MLDPKTLLPEVKRLVPQYSDKEIMAGIQEFHQTHPNFSNQQALQALTAALDEQKQAAPQGQPFEGLVSQLGGK